MEDLPYFLLLLKKNLLLYSIIMHGSFSQIDLNNVEHTVYSEGAIRLQNFYLSENEQFSSVDVILLDDIVELTFNTISSAYYEQPERYFQRSSVVISGTPYTLFGQQTQTNRKRIGECQLSEEDNLKASISVVKSTSYGYAIFVTIKHGKVK